MLSHGKEPADFQEVHSPTVQTEVVISHTPRRVRAGPRRRAAEEKFWSGLTGISPPQAPQEPPMTKSDTPIAQESGGR